jgi:ribosomal protein L7/L12
MISSTLIDLKKLLNSMEEDFGLNALSEVERNVFYAIKDLEQENGSAKTGQLLDHEFTSKISRISVFRSIKKLEKEKKIKKRGAKRGEYITTSSS